MSAISNLSAAISAYQAGNRITARQWVQRELVENPDNLRAWTWACELADSRDEKIRCLQEILRRNPSDQDAQRYLQRLTAANPSLSSADPMPAVVQAPQPAAGEKPKKVEGVGWIAAGAQLLAAALVIVVIVAAISAIPKSSFLGLRGPDFESLIISESFEDIQSDDYVWKIVYETKGNSEFAGAVRHTSPIRIGNLRILTHDILVTSGEFADPDIVNTSVNNHRFRWYSETKQHPEGRLNLLHTVPADEQIFAQLKAIEEWDQVSVSGREILRIDIYDLEGNYLGNWHDTGCNTLVVTSVSILGK